MRPCMYVSVCLSGIRVSGTSSCKGVRKNSRRDSEETK